MSAEGAGAPGALNESPPPGGPPAGGRDVIAECCCRAATARPGVCPRSGDVTRLVPWRTVAALVTGAVPPLEEYRLCPDADCPVVYVGSAGTLVDRSAVRAVPAFKRDSGDVLCHCFGLDRPTLQREVERLGESPSVTSIQRATVEGRCACDVRNPAGGCCLRDLAEAVRAARERSPR